MSKITKDFDFRFDISFKALLASAMKYLPLNYINDVVKNTQSSTGY